MILTDQQTAALEMVKSNRLSLLIGFPGTGKTTITREIVEWAKGKGYSIALASPTGKAANVLSEACGHPASTIHRLLKPMPMKKANGKLQFIFDHNANNPLQYDFIIIDECSMIGNDLMADLLRAIDPWGTKVLFVGDSCQLPSVQPGCVLRDLVSCGAIPITELTEVFRNSGAIIDLCTAIRTDDQIYMIPQHPIKKLNLENGENYIHIETSSVETIKETIIKLATENIPNKYEFTVNKGEIQVLSPVNSKTILSCDSLNTAIQDIVNIQPSENCIENTGFRLGSKVINCKNLYDCVSADTDDQEVVLNGDLGEITELDKDGNKMVVTFQDPIRKIVLNKWKNDLKLSYALTVHKSQGSQWNVIILPVHSCFQYSFSRALLYTACSRAKTLLFTIGQKSAIQAARRDISVYQRKTFLSERIRDKILCNL